MRVTGDGLEILPADVVALEATLGSAPRPAPSHERDWLAEGERYLTGELRTNAPAEMVIALMHEIRWLRSVTHWPTQCSPSETRNR